MNLKPMRGVAPKTLPLVGTFLVSPKIDGLRMLVRDGVALSKTLKPIPCPTVQAMFAHLHGADGELVVGPSRKQGDDDDVFDRTRGPAMRKTEQPDADFRFYIFDRWDCPDVEAAARCTSLLASEFGMHLSQSVRIVPQMLADSQQRIDAALEVVLARGYEGIMLRRTTGIYKYGQSTALEQHLLKMKPLKDSEAVIIGTKEQMANNNEATKDELGYMKRSSSKESKVGKDTLGTLIVRDIYTNVEFEIGGGPGITAAIRKELWERRGELEGRYLTYTYQEIGTKDKPRLPQFKAFRDAIDISALDQLSLPL
jgi:DNA ligase-1